MPLSNPRHLLLICAGLDMGGLVGLLALQVLNRQLSLVSQLGWIGAIAIAYLGLSWLFGAYSVLCWRRVPVSALLRRQAAVVIGILVLVAVVTWAMNLPDQVWLVWRRTLLQLLLPLGGWSVVLRLALRRGLLQPEEPRLLLVAPEHEAKQFLFDWNRTPNRLRLSLLSLKEAMAHAGPVLLAVSPTFRQHSRDQSDLAEFEERDPRQFKLTTPIALAERQLERLPPSFLPEPWLSYDEIPWSNPMRVERQLKRVADLFLASGLLLLVSPILLLAGLLIWLEDRGPVLYFQHRSGWLGQRFQVWKLRTMTVELPDAPASWTVPGDVRITHVGKWLRRSRLDELPQLVNVVRGEMSLIGPRPERPEIERRLEVLIPHYRKRHWMRPGLSGWAQVSAPYAASVEDSELKLSYDLYYIKNFNVWLDLLILFRTFKTVLKVAGR